MPDNNRADGTDDKPTGLALVCCLAALAGAVDACGLALLKDLYVSFMSGNTTSLGRAVAQADWQRVRLLAGIIAMFVTGAAAGDAIALLAGRFRLPVVVLVAAFVLAVPPVAMGVAVPCMTFSMGALNAAMHKAGPVQVSVTYATGTLVKLGQGLSRWAFGVANGTEWLQQTVPWIGLFVGATLAACAMGAVGMRSFAALPVLALAIAVAAYVAVPREEGE
jgi:uncharacterized membrane protein YoaK (UPF0700 family)